ncbi:MAG: hypothetical protein MZV63_33565 [Marinilabiliales bacterium]|nr:hypothetical protein [Marinilabiliales bacterium]
MIRRMGQVLVSRKSGIKAMESLRHAAELIRREKEFSFMVLPEGTRTRRLAGPFSRKAASGWRWKRGWRSCPWCRRAAFASTAAAACSSAPAASSSSSKADRDPRLRPREYHRVDGQGQGRFSAIRRAAARHRAPSGLSPDVVPTVGQGPLLSRFDGDFPADAGDAVEMAPHQEGQEYQFHQAGAGRCRWRTVPSSTFSFSILPLWLAASAFPRICRTTSTSTASCLRLLKARVPVSSTLK